MQNAAQDLYDVPRKRTFLCVQGYARGLETSNTLPKFPVVFFPVLAKNQDVIHVTYLPLGSSQDAEHLALKEFKGCCDGEKQPILEKSPEWSYEGCEFP